MMKAEQRIKQIFQQDTPLPEIVTAKQQEAYRLIYSKRDLTPPDLGGKTASHHRQKSMGHSSLFKAAALLLGCLLVLGGTSVSAVKFLGWWDKLKAMDEKTMHEIGETVQSGGALIFLHSRAFTDEEKQRYDALKMAYRNNEKYPEKALPVIHQGEAAPPTGVYLLITPQGEENILCMPDTPLTDEEMLEMIDHITKDEYYIYENVRQEIIAKENWASRMEQMTDEEVDYYYLVWAYAKTETGGGYHRGQPADDLTGKVLTSEEEKRYAALLKAYEEENLCPAQVLPTIIEHPEDYSGDGIAFCKYDADYYLPQRELTDEEMLEIIDFRKRTDYVCSRIDREISLGYRTDYPKPEGYVEPIYVEPTGIPVGTLKSIANAQAGDRVYFGSYDQDNNLSNGKETIEWHVLEADEETITLLAATVLDSFVWDDTTADGVIWENSRIRKWLNHEFYENAFSEEEQSRIQLSTLPESGFNDTKDYVYLLSLVELLDYFGLDNKKITNIRYHSGLEEQYRYDSVGPHGEDIRVIDSERLLYDHVDSRIYPIASQAAIAGAAPVWTKERVEKNQKGTRDQSYALGKCDWWLRSTAMIDEKREVSYVKGTGDFSYGSQENCSGIRPVIKIHR